MHAHHNARARALIHNNSLQWCPCATHFSCFLSSPRYTLFSVTCYHCACSHFCVSAQCLCPQLYLCSSLSLSLPLSLDPYLPLFPSLRLSVDPLLTVTDTLIIPRSVRLNAAISLPPPLMSAATSFFRERAPEFFKDFFTSLFTMFQVLSGDSWASGVSRTMFS